MTREGSVSLSATIRQVDAETGHRSDHPRNSRGILKELLNLLQLLSLDDMAGGSEEALFLVRGSDNTMRRTRATSHSSPGIRSFLPKELSDPHI